jgi:hypothetical protein
VRTQKTILVLGAGASAGFKLPLGSGLRTTIADDLNIMFDDWGQSLESGSPEIVEALRLINRLPDGRSGDINPHRHAAIQIAGSMRLSSSIDEYIERHKKDVLRVECAKLAIAKAILEAERNSTIYADPQGRNDPFENAADSWLASLLRDLTRGLGKDELSEAFENLTIINFNYDRCVEHFSYHWFQRVYDLTEAESALVCNDLRIYHPYGSLGPLPQQNAKSSIPYGAKPIAQRLLDISKRIQTYSEAVDEVTQPGFVASDLRAAKRIVFLGFGFHAQNIRILGAGAAGRATLRCYASTDGIRAPRLELIRASLAAQMQVEAPNGLFFDHVGGDCEAFWAEYGDVVSQ